MSEGSGVPASHGTNILRNIIVGVTTTVLGSSAIYFLGFNHRNQGSSGNDYLVVKDATVKAWKSYVTTENIYTKNTLSLMKELGETKKLDEFEENIFVESGKFTDDLEQLIKDERIDGDFISMIKRRLQNEKAALPKTKTYLENIKSIVKSGDSQNEKTKKLAEEDRIWVTNSKGTTERAVTDIEDIAKTLSEKYGQPFAMSDILMYKMIKEQGAITTDTIATKNNNPKPGQANEPVSPNSNNASTINNNPVNNNPVDNTNVDPEKDKNIVNDNYNKPVNNNNTITVTKKMITGGWSTYNAEIYLSKDGEMSWDVINNGDNAYGTWKLTNNQLYMYATNSRTRQQATWVFNLSKVKANSFTMTLSTAPYTFYNLVKMDADY